MKGGSEDGASIAKRAPMTTYRELREIMRREGPGETVLYTGVLGLALRIDIRETRHKRGASARLGAQRRRSTLALALIRLIHRMGHPEAAEITEEEYTRAEISHLADPWTNKLRNQERGQSLRHALSSDTKEQRFGFRMRMRRLEIGHSQEGMAAKLGIDRGHLSRIERGAHWPRPALLAEICRVLNLPMPQEPHN